VRNWSVSGIGIPFFSNLLGSIVPNLQRGARASGTAESPQYGWSLSSRALEPKAIARGNHGRLRRRRGRASIQPTRRQTPQHGAPRRRQVASDANLGTASSSLGTWNSLIFCGLTPGTSILDRPTFPGAYGGCADRYAPFGSMSAKHAVRRLSCAIPLGARVMARAGHTTCGVLHFGRSANCQRTCEPPG